MMIQPTKEVLGSVVRLSQDPDFRRFIGWVEEMEQSARGGLERAHKTNMVFRSQGAYSALSDVIQTVRTARERVKSINGQAPTPDARSKVRDYIPGHDLIYDEI